MRLTLEVVPSDTAELRVRLTALNDSYEPVTLDRRTLVGPHLRPGGAVGAFGVALEPPSDSDNEILLNPWCFYGRERSLGEPPAGPVTVCAYRTTEPVSALLPDGPADADLLAEAAEPLTLNVG